MRGDGPRKQNRVNIGRAAGPDNGRVRLPKEFIANPARMEVARVGQEHVGSTQLASGRFAMIDHGIDLQPVPWQPPREGRA